MEVRMNKRKVVNYGLIEIRQCFIYDKELYIKTHVVRDCNDYNSVCLNDGEFEYFF